jgi:hypothetical protein
MQTVWVLYITHGDCYDPEYWPGISVNIEE